MAKYICFEGTDGCYKTTNVNMLVKHLRGLGFRVMQTKEPGTDLIPLTMSLRAMMLDNDNADVITPVARELIAQAIRSIHLNYIDVNQHNYDYIIQDRGIMSGIAYAKALGHSEKKLEKLYEFVYNTSGFIDERLVVYDRIIFLYNDPKDGLKNALDSKKEYKSGDFMESQGADYMQRVQDIMMDLSSDSYLTKSVFVGNNKSREEIFAEVLGAIKDV